MAGFYLPAVGPVEGAYSGRDRRVERLQRTARLHAIIDIYRRLISCPAALGVAV